MSEARLPLVEHEGTQGPINAAPTHGVPAIAEGGTRGPSLMTPLGRVEGVVWTYLDEDDATRLRDFPRPLGWSASMVRNGSGCAHSRRPGGRQTPARERHGEPQGIPPGLS